MSEENNIVSDYYDNFNINRKGRYRNLRHYKLLCKLFDEGLNKKSNICEIGCGSGPIGSVIINYVTKGYYLGMDISSASIKKMEKEFGHRKNVTFVNSDIADFKTNLHFDFILLADVLEHVPVQNHKKTFQLLHELCKKGGKVIVNIPTKELIEWQKINEPHILQIIDQPLSTDYVISNAINAGFNCLNSYKHTLFHTTDDYELFIFQKPPSKKIEFSNRPKIRIILDKFYYRIKLNSRVIFKI